MRSAASVPGSAPARTPTRTIVLWCPDWPIVAAAQTHDVAVTAPIALIEHGEVFACSATARRDGVRRGLRQREAQARCPELIVLPSDPGHDHRAFEPVITAIEERMPGVQVMRPGTCAIKARGPARYYGGEEAVGELLLDIARAQLVPLARVGIADGPFAAEQAARLPGNTLVRLVPAGESPVFLEKLPLMLLQRPELVTLLLRLGIRTLGDFAALDELDVLNRFGEDGAHAHRMASGRDTRPVMPRTPPAELDCAIDFEPPLDRVDQIAFGFRTASERFAAQLTAVKLVATAIRIEIHGDDGRVSERSWLHPRWFTASDVLDRVRWQLQGSGTADSGLRAPVTRVMVEPEAVDSIGNHEEGLWGGGPDERVHSGLSRVQSMLGHEGVLTARLAGGRMLSDRSILVPWGDLPPDGEASTAKRRQQPWPGSIPGPSPTTVFERPLPVTVLSDAGQSLEVDDRGRLSGTPARFSPTEVATTWRAVKSWAGPWSVNERWWDAAGRRVSRLQLVDGNGVAWLLFLERKRWWAEAVYD